MNDIVYYIAPRAGLTSLFTRAEVADKNDKGKLITTGAQFGSPFAPKSKQRLKPTFKTIKRSFPTTLSKEELDALVKESALVYEATSPFAGQLITKANPKDRKDAFFNHSECSITLMEGAVTFEPQNPIHKVLIDSFSTGENPRVGVYKPGVSVYPKEVQFLLYKVGDETKEASNEAIDMMDFFKLIGAKSQKELFVLAVALDLNVKVDEDQKTLLGMIYTKLMDARDKGLDRDGNKIFDTVMEILKMKSGDLRVKYLINRALKEGRSTLLRYDYGTDSWFVKDYNTRAKTPEELENFLKEPSNQGTLSLLQNAFNDDNNTRESTPERDPTEDKS